MRSEGRGVGDFYAWANQRAATTADLRGHAAHTSEIGRKRNGRFGSE
jgi:hypothetical protein